MNMINMMNGDYDNDDAWWVMNMMNDAAWWMMDDDRMMMDIGWWMMNLQNKFGERRRGGGELHYTTTTHYQTARTLTWLMLISTNVFAAGCSISNNRIIVAPSLLMVTLRPSATSLSIPLGPSVVRTISATDWQALMLLISCALPYIC
jgi:hypothetical protein